MVWFSTRRVCPWIETHCVFAGVNPLCCFSQPILSVARTKIFARLGDRGKQFIAYEMEYVSETPNAMILPLPTQLPASEDSIRFISLDGYPKFFDHLRKGFPYRRPSVLSTDSAVGRVAAANIEVHEVGDYVASFVPTIDDFDRLDARFVIPKSTWNLIPAYHDYSFAVFQLAKLSAKPHPMAFEFSSRHDSQVFFPTVHIHDGAVHETEDFDHELYVQDEALDRAVGPYRNSNEADPATHWVRSDRKVAEFAKVASSAGLLIPELLVHRKQLEGNLPNQDQFVAFAGFVPAVSVNDSRLLRYLPWAIAGGVLAWLLHRRNQIKASEVRSLRP